MYCYLEFTNLELFSIRVEELFEPIIVLPKKQNKKKKPNKKKTKQNKTKQKSKNKKQKQKQKQKQNKTNKKSDGFLLF